MCTDFWLETWNSFSYSDDLYCPRLVYFSYKNFFVPDMNGGLPPLYRRMSPVPGGGLMTAGGNVLMAGPGRPPSSTGRGTSPTARGQQPLIINNSLEVQQQVPFIFYLNFLSWLFLYLNFSSKYGITHMYVCMADSI